MKVVLVVAGLWVGLGICRPQTQGCKDPLRDYYQRDFSQVDFSKESVPDTEGPSPPVTPETKINYFEADFTGDGSKSLFITSGEAYLGVRGDYAWSVYYPVASGGYRLATNFISTGLGGPGYIGYIDEIKKYGVVLGGKDTVTAMYLDNGSIQMGVIDNERYHADAARYPKYFHSKFISRDIRTITLAQLIKKYGHPDQKSGVAPAGK